MSRLIGWLMTLKIKSGCNRFLPDACFASSLESMSVSASASATHRVKVDATLCLSFDAVATASEKTFDSIDANFCVKTIFSDARQSDSKIRRFNWSSLKSKIRLSHKSTITKKLSEPYLWRILSLSFCCVKVEPNWIQDKTNFQRTNH